MYFKGNYYPFCNRGFTREFATLACRALGFWYGGFVLPSKGINFLETIEVGNCPSVENGVWDYQRNYLEECINSTFSLSTNECDAVQVTCLLPCKYRIIYPGFVSNKVDYVILFFCTSISLSNTCTHTHNEILTQFDANENGPNWE